MTSKSKVKSAYHEAGHAVANLYLKLPFRKVTISGNKDYLGAVICDRLSKAFAKRVELEDLTPVHFDRIEREIVALLAGHEAERRFSGRRNSVGAASDYDKAVEWVFRTRDLDEAPYYIKQLEIRTRKLIEREWPQVELITKALLDRETLTSKEAKFLWATFGRRKPSTT